MNDATRLDPAERERCKPLARRILEIERQVGLRRVTFDWLRTECRQQRYVWGDLFLQVLEMGARYQAGAQLDGARQALTVAERPSRLPHR